MKFPPYRGYAIVRRTRSYQLGFAAVKGGKDAAWNLSLTELHRKLDGQLSAATAGEKMITPSAATGPNMAGDLSYGD